jgi:hypothetical protein
VVNNSISKFKAHKKASIICLTSICEKHKLTDNSGDKHIETLIFVGSKVLKKTGISAVLFQNRRNVDEHFVAQLIAF